MTIPTAIQTGYLAGMTADFAPDEFGMSTYAADYTLGFIMGYSESQSIQMASPDVAVWTAAELAYRYKVSVRDLLSHMGLDREQTQHFHDAYEEEREN
ncbi:MULTISPECIES: DUF2623 family protein [Achromobacter]|uniref:Uncharacterized protein n=1 Tax=Achromobacter mucicolens TaxID=1389922 RepID=A0ABM8LKB1_9BURK|nr:MULTISPECIES: DUF2623 family protein [Achromobacter]AVG43875.1 DUF2623 domain-containing protein [Achromobacter insolitus]CAB3845809.1 hypothetical protein LMG3410_01509 [Achromobacter aegrifaciens]CAB3914203.1 hypothetical protein LMG3415_05140 [Achromobacter mucicolens]